MTDDPIYDFNKWDAQQNKKLAKLPHCEYCDDPITADKALYWHDMWFCEQCESSAWEEIREELMERVPDD